MKVTCVNDVAGRVIPVIVATQASQKSVFFHLMRHRMTGIILPLPVYGALVFNIDYFDGKVLIHM